MDSGRYVGNILERNGIKYIEMSREKYGSFKDETREVRESDLRSVSFDKVYDRSDETPRRLRFRDLMPFRNVSFRSA
jgi:hypothetical protein|tara:strand:- start:444 stop:674 length:231 start_codon:yes stop_codon:yes gene_type:complete